VGQRVLVSREELKMLVPVAVVLVDEGDLDRTPADREPHQRVTSCQMATRQTAIVTTTARISRAILIQSPRTR
jgi:hypothetical protein